MINRSKFYLLFTIIVVFSSCSSRIPIYSKHKQNSSVTSYLYYYEGIKKRLANNLQEAITYQLQSIRIDSTNSAPYYELALSYSQLQEFDKAINLLEKAVKIEPNNKFYRHYLGVLYLNTKQTYKALENQTYLVQLDSLNPSYKYSLALLYNDSGEKEESLRLLTEINDQTGYNPQIADTKIKIFFDDNKLNQAQEEIDKLLQLYPNVALYHLYNSELNFRLGNDSIAFSSLNKAIELEPENAYIKVNKYLQLQKTAKAEEYLNYFVSISSDTTISSKTFIELFYPLLYEPTFYLSHKEKLDSIISNLLNNFKSFVEIHALAYEHFLNTRNFVEARKQLSYMIEYDPENVDNWEKAISFDFSMSNFLSAIVLAKQATAKFPQNDLFYVLQAVSLDNIEKTNEAITVLKKGVSNIKDNPIAVSELLSTIADLYYKINEEKLAYKFYRKSLKKNPNNARTLNNYSYYLSLKKSNLARALKMSSKAVDLEPNNSTYIDTKGWVLFQMGRYEEAKNVLQNAVAKDGNKSPVIIEHYADALYKSGNKETAFIYWLKARDLGGNSVLLQKKIEKKSYVEK